MKTEINRESVSKALQCIPPRPWKAETSCVIDASDIIIISCVAGAVYRKENEAEDYVTAGMLSAMPEMVDALTDMLSGWRYIRETHGDLYGVGWDRCEKAAEDALRKAMRISDER